MYLVTRLFLLNLLSFHQENFYSRRKTLCDTFHLSRYRIKKESIRELFELKKDSKEEDTLLFLLTGILVSTDKVIEKEIAKRIEK